MEPFLTLSCLSLCIDDGGIAYRLARCAVKWVSDCRWAGKAGNEGCACEGVEPLSECSAMAMAQRGKSRPRRPERAANLAGRRKCDVESAIPSSDSKWKSRIKAQEALRGIKRQEERETGV